MIDWTTGHGRHRDHCLGSVERRVESDGAGFDPGVQAAQLEFKLRGLRRCNQPFETGGPLHARRRSRHGGLRTSADPDTRAGDPLWLQAAMAQLPPSGRIHALRLPLVAMSPEQRRSTLRAAVLRPADARPAWPSGLTPPRRPKPDRPSRVVVRSQMATRRRGRSSHVHSITQLPPSGRIHALRLPLVAMSPEQRRSTLRAAVLRHLPTPAPPGPAD